MLDLQTLGILVSLVLGMVTLVGVIFAGGRFVQRHADMKEDLEKAHTRLDAAERDLAAGKVRFGVMETKLDTILRQQDRIERSIDKLVQDKDD